MFPRMYSSVKFFEPTVSETLPLAGFFWMRLEEPELLVVLDELELLLEPQAETPSASATTSANAKSPCLRADVIWSSPLVGCRRVTRDAGILCAGRRALQPQPFWGQEVLDADQH